MPLDLIECLEFTIKEDMLQYKRKCLDNQKKKCAFDPIYVINDHEKKLYSKSNSGKFLIQEVAKIAGWGDEQIEYMKEKITEEGRKEEVNKGKLPAQVKILHSIDKNIS